MTVCRSRRRQVVEIQCCRLFCWSHNPKVGRSNPPPATKPSVWFQWVEPISRTGSVTLNPSSQPKFQNFFTHSFTQPLRRAPVSGFRLDEGRDRKDAALTDPANNFVLFGRSATIETVCTSVIIWQAWTWSGVEAAVSSERIVRQPEAGITSS